MDTADDTQIEVPYNRDLKALEDVLAAVRRPGDYFVRGALETPMPRVEIDGVGVISFPIPDSQVQDIIKHAERAPYGRGGETILDTSVRNAWQLAPANVRIGGLAYMNIRDAPRDLVQADMWLQLAAAAGARAGSRSVGSPAQ